MERFATMKNVRTQLRGWKALRDLVLISLALAGLLWLGAVTEAFGGIYRWLEGRFHDNAGDVLVALALTGVGLCVFALRLWRSEQREAAARVGAEARYRSLVEQMPVVTYLDDDLHDPPQRYVAPSVHRLLGITQVDWLSDPDVWESHLHPDDRARVVETVRRGRETGGPLTLEYRMTAKDGSVVWVNDDARIVEQGPTPDRSVWQGMVVDVTARKHAEQQLQEAEQRYRSLVESMPAVTYIDTIDEEWSAIYTSPQIEAMFGYTQEEWKDHSIWEGAIHPDDRDRVLGAVDRHNREGAPYNMEYRLRAKDGRWTWVSDHATVVAHEEWAVRYSQGVMLDITERKLAEQALRSSEQREREAAERLRALDEMKNTFLAAVSHELRSPLTSILGLSLTMEHQELPEDDRRDLTSRLAQNARKLDRLLKDLLDIDRLSRGIVTLQDRPTDLGGLIRRTVESLELGDRRVSVEAETMIVPVEPAKVERIVENLVMNAIRHTERDVPIRIRLWRQDGGAVLAVEDEGAGVPDHLQAAIFEPFRQGPTAAPHSPGTGIGLSLVGMFAELHGGRAWVEEREGGGASFRVFLPGSHAGGSKGTQPVSRLEREDVAAAVDPVRAR